MFNKYVCSIGIVFLGLYPWMPGVHAEEVVATNGAASATEEIAGPEHGKINTADASPVEPGHFEVESSYASAHTKRFWDKVGDVLGRKLAESQTLGLSATAGVIPDVDVAVNGGYVWLQDKENAFNPEDGELGPEHGHGLGDLAINGRYRFFQSKEHNLEMAYIGGFTLPTGSSSNRNQIGTSQEFWSLNQTLVATKDWGKWTANVDVGYALPLGDKRAQARGTLNADAAVGYQVLPWLQPEMELNYGHDFFAVEDDKQVLAVTVGLVMPVNDRFRVNVGVQQDVWGQNTDKTTSVYAALKVAF